MMESRVFATLAGSACPDFGVRREVANLVEEAFGEATVPSDCKR